MVVAVDGDSGVVGVVGEGLGDTCCACCGGEAAVVVPGVGVAVGGGEEVPGVV